MGVLTNHYPGLSQTRIATAKKPLDPSDIESFRPNSNFIFMSKAAKRDWSWTDVTNTPTGFICSISAVDLQTTPFQRNWHYDCSSRYRSRSWWGVSIVLLTRVLRSTLSRPRCLTRGTSKVLRCWIPCSRLVQVLPVQPDLRNIRTISSRQPVMRCSTRLPNWSTVVRRVHVGYRWNNSDLFDLIAISTLKVPPKELASCGLAHNLWRSEIIMLHQWCRCSSRRLKLKTEPSWFGSRTNWNQSSVRFNYHRVSSCDQERRRL